MRQVSNTFWGVFLLVLIWDYLSFVYILFCRQLSLLFFPSPLLCHYFHCLPFLQPNNPLHFLLLLHQRSVWVHWRSAAPSCHVTFRAWCSVATNAPSHAPVTRPCSCTCKSTLRSNPTSASSVIMTAVDGASQRSIYALSTRSAGFCMMFCATKLN